jgi:hypothetical protein
MKCDRVYPVCGRCQKTGRANQCTYDPRLLEDLTGNDGIQAERRTPLVTLPDNTVQGYAQDASSLEAMRLRARAQERRIEDLERKLAAKEDDSNKDPSYYRDTKPEEPTARDEMMFRGKGFKTQFNGSTSVMSTIAQVQGPSSV